MEKQGSSIFGRMVAGDLGEETFSVDAEAMFFIFEQIERLGLAIEGEGSVVAGLQRLSSFEEHRDLYRALAATGKTVAVLAYPDAGVEPEPGVAFVPLAKESALADERFLVFQSPEMSSVLFAREENASPVDEPAPPKAERRFTGVWSFSHAHGALAREAIAEQVEGLPEAPPAPAQEPKWRADLLSGLMSRVIGRMEEQKREIHAVLEAFEDAATGAEIEAWRDPTSRLPQREYFMERLDDIAKRASSAGRGRCCLLLLGVEGVNPDDQPEAMREFADLMGGLVRSSDFFGHVGGGLVAIGTPNIELANAEAAANRFLGALKPFAETHGSRGVEGLAISALELGASAGDSGEAVLAMAIELRGQALEEKSGVKAASPANSA